MHYDKVVSLLEFGYKFKQYTIFWNKLQIELNILERKLFQLCHTSKSFSPIKSVTYIYLKDGHLDIVTIINFLHLEIL